MKCGECLIERVKMVELVSGQCPECGSDYRNMPIQVVKNLFFEVGMRVSGTYSKLPFRGEVVKVEGKHVIVLLDPDCVGRSMPTGPVIVDGHTVSALSVEVGHKNQTIRPESK